ncbi:MAG TPA: hypothetical protein VGK94_06465 [Candidatus Polarisedimenticolia bacterium]|jgi:hypothetical protein
MNGTSLLLAVALLVPAAAPATGPVPAAESLSISQITALLKAGVGEEIILRQIQMARSRPALTVDAILELKGAGASDALLAALMPEPHEGAVETRSVAGGLRVYRQMNDRGEAILYVTNLDPAGRRIGGELEAGPPSRSEAEPLPRQGSRHAEDFETGQAPVIVNIYQAGESPGSIAGEVYQPASPYRFGRYPGLPLWSRFDRTRHPAGAREEFFGRPRAIDTAPYRSGTAAERNRAHFRRD